ncbi:sulfatase-like hydrolase/transferase [Catenovulum adriaticum]|uniref:Sulfatase-like hydrolase/transferase n=1 Tax=Catenovulum adriaticum TaxID=2984846 RepID=A0ABY7ATN1_9ALTE|nr:sulfatase-like hydrolase/transferase [Catenovulum sp. TS8]WAJ71875.1 sulfatase-like hydrolase/transferase [Catenovulum sp. TS8]
MKTIIKPVLISLLASFVVAPNLANAKAQADLPNVVVILADDLGLGDVSKFHKQYSDKPVVAPTPNIDQLAQAGMSFMDAHSPTALCAPSRYSVMSGNSTYRGYAPWGVWSSFAPSSITNDDATIGRVAKQAGYTTGFVGKWHLGGTFNLKSEDKAYRGPKTGKETLKVDMRKWIDDNPSSMGFDYDFTTPTGVQGPLYFLYENNDWYPFSKNSEIVFLDENNAIDPKFVSDKGPGMGDSHWNARELNMMLANKAADFIKRSAGDKPFLLNYWSPAVHIPHTPPQQINGNKIAGQTPTNHLDMNLVLDLEVKKIVQALKDAGEYDNTLIIFTSDNGGLIDFKAQKQGHNSAAQYRGYKNQPYEGGHRVPFITVWPGKIKANTQSDSLVNGTDIVATLANIMDVKLNAHQAKDSWNLLPLLEGKPYQERPLLMAQSGSENELMLRQGDWKIIIKTNYKLTKRKLMSLYNLADDPQEKNNLVNDSKYKDKAKMMYELYWKIRESGERTAPVM